MNISALSQIDLLKSSRFVAIKEIQQRPAQLFDWRKIITSNGKPRGISFSIEEWEEIMEDLDAIQSPTYWKKIAQSRKSKKFYSKEDIVKDFKLWIIK